MDAHYRVAIFGSARIREGDPVYRDIYEIARGLAECGFDIVTGGGPGIMQAANAGHKSVLTETHSIGLRITLPFEQEMNKYLDINGQKIKYGLAKKIYGEYPPHSSLNYIWANRKNEMGIVTNSYADEAKMIILQAGPDRIGQWQEEDVNILDGYRKAFGTDPPAIAGIAIMNDSDNTGEHSVSYIDYMEVSK